MAHRARRRAQCCSCPATQHALDHRRAAARHRRARCRSGTAQADGRQAQAAAGTPRSRAIRRLQRAARRAADADHRRSTEGFDERRRTGAAIKAAQAAARSQAARAPAARDAGPLPQGICGRHAVRLQRMRRQAAPDRRGRGRATGIRAGALQGHPPCAPQAGVHALRRHLPGDGAEPADCTRPARAGAAGARDGGQVLRPHAPVPPEPHLWARRRGHRPLHDGGLGGPGRRVGRAAGSRAGPLHAGRRQGARRRHAGAGARSRARPDQDRQAVGVRTRRPTLRQQGCAGGVVPVLARSWRRASARTPQALPRHPAGRCVLGLLEALRQRPRRARSMHGPCETVLLGRVRGAQARSRLGGRAGAAAHRQAVRDRSRHPRPTAR
ncbi:hypothetical protein Y694_02342 [Methylibium sp. T29-B]|nr:hypothetical protein Y694_02342 [Methylibium sp. T29-B]